MRAEQKWHLPHLAVDAGAQADPFLFSSFSNNLALCFLLWKSTMSLIKSYAAKLPPAVIRQIIVRKIYTCLCVECFIVSPLCKGCEIIYNNLWHIYTRPSLKFLSQTCTWFYLFRRLGYKLQADNHTHHGQYTLFITVEPNAFNRFNISFTNHCNITKICWK